MPKITFREAMEKGLPWYEVSRGGAIFSRKPLIFSSDKNELWLDTTSTHLTESGNISKDWGHALFANAEDAAEVAKRIVTTKYNNSMAKIKKVTGF